MFPLPQRFFPIRERVVLVEWEPRIDPAINARVHAVARACAQWPEVVSVVPAYASLQLQFDRPLHRLPQWEDRLRGITEQPLPTSTNPGRRHRIPVRYDGPDLGTVSELTGLGIDEIIALHTGTEYRVYLLGFLPGFPYLGSVPEALRVPRRAEPRRSVPPGAVGLAGAQTGIYPSAAPGGWQLIGQTDVQLFDPAREEPFLLAPGDRVRFSRS
jgi:KipI family sensor histidine kinase inhibitor